MRNMKLTVCVIALVIAAGACTSYKKQVVPFKMPAAYENATEVAGATVAARAFDDPKEAQEAFGWDIRSAGLYPVQITFDNGGDQALEIDPTQTFLVDAQDNVWSILDKSLAYDRVASGSEIARIGKGAAKTGVLAGVAGAVLGAAIGIVAGENVGAAAGKGAVIGGALGATIGGAKAATSEGEARAEISGDLQTKSLGNNPVLPHTIAHGFIFFPGEATDAKELRLRLRVVDSGELYTVRFAL